VALLNSKEFVRGMLEPVQPETFDYYWQQGWPKEMLLYLFVHRIEKAGHTYNNNPFDGTFANFQKEIEDIAYNECDLIMTEVPSDGLIGPEIKPEAAADLKNLIELHKAGLKLTSAQRNNEKADTYRLSLNQGDCAIDCGTGRDENVSARYKVLPDNAAHNVGDKTKEDRIYLRSPEAMLYYLGEIVRATADPKTGKPPKLKGGRDGSCQPWLFVARKAGAEDTNPFVAVEYEGTKYVIPGTDSGEPCPEDLSTSVLSLLSLVTAKQSASDLPVPVGVVTTIGR
jgi:hypothetical protein